MSVAKQSTAKFIFPFSFSSRSFEARAAAIDRTEWGELNNIWRTANFQSDDLLPVVDRYLNGATGQAGQAKIWKLDGNALQSPKGLGGGAKNATCQWRVKQRKLQVSFRLLSVELLMFHAGVGFVVFEAVPESDALGDWFDFIHAFRFFEGRGTKLQCSLKLSAGGQLDFFPDLCGGLEQHPQGVGTTLDLVKCILASGNLDADQSRWWQEEFVLGQAIPYCCLFLKSLPAEEDAMTIYRLRNLFYSAQEVRLAAEDLELRHGSLLTYADREWFVISLDSAILLPSIHPILPFSIRHCLGIWPVSICCCY